MNPYRDPPAAEISPAWVLALRYRYRRFLRQRRNIVARPLDQANVVGTRDGVVIERAVLGTDPES